MIKWRGTRAATRQGFVRWLGFNLATGRDWDDSWIPRAWMTSDLRQAGLIRKPKRAEAGADTGSGGSDARGDGQEIRDEPEVTARSKQAARIVWQRGLGAIPPGREETDESRERAIPDFTASQSRLRDRSYG